MAKLLIVDGHAYAYRAFYAIRSLNSPTGQPTNAIYGFVKMLAKMRTILQPTHLIVVWDGGLSKARRESLPEYKAQRPDMPADLAAQLDEIGRYLAAAKIESFCGRGIEADDYIALVTREARQAGFEVIIASADKDFMQLVGSGVGLLNPNDKSEAVWSVEQVRAKTGVAPEQIVDWLSLVGDSVDNIPGVPGVGPKTATGLLQQFGSVAELYAQLETVKSDRIRESLRSSEAVVKRNRDLVRLQTDLGETVELEKLTVQVADFGRLADLFREWGFRTLLAETLAATGVQPDLI